MNGTSDTREPRSRARRGESRWYIDGADDDRLVGVSPTGVARDGPADHALELDLVVDLGDADVAR